MSTDTNRLKLKARIKELEAANAEMRAALEFYADSDTYFAIGFFPDHPCGDFMDDFEKIDGIHRPGKRARKALHRGAKK